MLGFLAAASAGTAVKARAAAKATTHKKKVFVDDGLIFSSFHSQPCIFGVQTFNFFWHLFPKITNITKAGT
jgi:hypothetical protein